MLKRPMNLPRCASLVAVFVCLMSGALASDSASGPATGVQAAAHKAGQAAERGARAVATGVEKGAKAAARGVKVGASAAARGVAKGARAVARAADSVAEKARPGEAER
jgi:hypothetical protein